MTADVTGRRLGPSAFRRSECHRSNRHDYVAGWNHYGFQWQVKVTAVEIGTRDTHSAGANEQGYYLFEFIRVGTYEGLCRDE